ncbi:MAG: medium chain dehydrogenase/reductase family protein [Acidimicrobiales bacterium]
MVDRALALVLTDSEKLELTEFALPSIASDDALLKVEACGLCGTDHEQFTGAIDLGFSFIPGHEVIGTIDRIGTAASKKWGVKEGDRVAVEVFQSCQQCGPCLNGSYQRCARHGIRAMYGHRNVSASPALWGGYATHMYLAPDSLLLPIPTDLDPIVATLFNPVGAGIRWGVDVPGTKVGDVCVVLGPGIRGLAAAAAMKDAGARFVMVVGVRPQDDDRLDLAKHFGADLVVDAATDDVVSMLRDAAHSLADVVLDVTAKAPAAFRSALRLARTGGAIVLAGTRGADVDVPGVELDRVVYKELRILGALGVDRSAYQRAINILVSGQYDFAALPHRLGHLDTTEDLLRTMAGSTPGPLPVHAVVVPTWSDCE